MIPFKKLTIGSLWKRTEIHNLFGGQRRGGISTPSGKPYIILFTGPSGEEFGYRDGWDEDGFFRYTGEGQEGDMSFVRGNRAIRDHVKDGKVLPIEITFKVKYDPTRGSVDIDKS